MGNQAKHITNLFSIRNHYGKNAAAEKIEILNSILVKTIRSKKNIQQYHDSLLFLVAYPDNKTIYTLANQCLQQLYLHIRDAKQLQFSLYNSGITNTAVCAAFSFEMVKWIRNRYPDNIQIISYEASDDQIQAMLSSLMPKIESEILQDAYFNWKEWLQKSLDANQTLLDGLLAVFESSECRPEVKDELWNAIGINTEIDFPMPVSIGETLFTPYYHRSLLRKKLHQTTTLPVRVKLNYEEAAQIESSSKLILVRHLREIDAISFTEAKLIAYYQMPRGISIALMGMMPERRHPIDSFMGYTVFKNGLPVAYAGSWILFNSSRIGLNIFPAYRGGESQYIFQQVLLVHAAVYRLKRFTVDPYQVGNKNSDGINSGAFWVYYHAGFRPLLKEQREIAAEEAKKIKSKKGYRSSPAILKQLAESKLEMVLHKNAVRFDANDLSLAYISILKKQYNNNRMLAEKDKVKKLAAILHIKNYEEPKIRFVLQNWAVLLFNNEPALRKNVLLKKTLKKLFVLKASGSEEAYIVLLQKAVALRKFIEDILNEE